MRAAFLLVIFCFFVANSFAGELVERLVEVTTDEKNPAVARTQLMNQASEKVSEELIKELIGEARYVKNKSLIQSKIIKKSATFLPFVRAGELKAVLPQGFQMAVTLKVSLDDLEKALLVQGLFYESDTTPHLLPVIRWVDGVRNEQFGWWTPDLGSAKHVLAKFSKGFEGTLSQEFLKKGFLALKPQSYSYADALSVSARSEPSFQDEISVWMQHWNSQMVIQGTVQISAGTRLDTYTLNFRISVLHASGRVIAEVVRVYETESGPMERVVENKLKVAEAQVALELTSQTLEAWQQGVIHSQLYRVRVANRVPLKTQEQMKEQLKSKVREIKSVKERIIDSSQLVYEIDSSMGPKDIAKKIGTIEIDGLVFVVDMATDSELTLKLKAQ